MGLNFGKFFAGVITVISAAAAIGYLFHRDWKLAIYWTCASVITYVVNF